VILNMTWTSLSEIEQLFFSIIARMRPFGLIFFSLRLKSFETRNAYFVTMTSSKVLRIEEPKEMMQSK
jgi:hypothetical protein